MTSSAQVRKARRNWLKLRCCYKCRDGSKPLSSFPGNTICRYTFVGTRCTFKRCMDLWEYQCEGAIHE